MTPNPSFRSAGAGWLALAAGLLATPVDAWAQAVTAAAKGGDAVQEVVVTATRRSERLQDVSLAVTSLSATQLAESGVKDLANLQFVVPGLQVGDSVSDKGFRIRGVGSLTGTYITGQELPVGVLVDGIVQGLGASLSNLADVERIEIIKGPQGTQFGKNAAAGVINVVTARPQPGRQAAEVSASYGSGGEYELRAMLNAPLGTAAALRASVFSKGHGDFVDNLATGQQIGGDRQSGLRLKLLLQPARDLELVLTADNSRQDIRSNSQFWTLNRSPVPQPGIVYGLDNLKTAESRPGQHRLDRSGVSLEANLRLGQHTLSSLTAWRRLQETDQGGFGLGFGAVPFPPFTLPGTTWYSDFAWDRRQTTQELRITSPKGAALEYVAGYLYYLQPTCQVP